MQAKSEILTLDTTEPAVTGKWVLELHINLDCGVSAACMRNALFRFNNMPIAYGIPVPISRRRPDRPFSRNKGGKY
jgi:hypothetical protein